MIYLASPYSHLDPGVRNARFEAACRAAAGLIRAGEIVFSPIAHSHALCKHGLPEDWATWRGIDLAVLAACTELRVLTLPGWTESVGVHAEISWAIKHGLPVRLIAPA